MCHVFSLERNRFDTCIRYSPLTLALMKTFVRPLKSLSRKYQPIKILNLLPSRKWDFNKTWHITWSPFSPFPIENIFQWRLFLIRILLLFSANILTTPTITLQNHTNIKSQIYLWALEIFKVVTLQKKYNWKKLACPRLTESRYS